MNQFSDALLEDILKNSQVTSIDTAFEKLLDGYINISKGTRSEACTSQIHLRNFINQESQTDDTFPRILSIEDSDFLGGSYARHTKIWPLDDIDIYFPIDGHNLFYFENGFKVSCDVISDGKLETNNILLLCWADDRHVSPKKLINGFATILKRHYPDATKVRADGQAVNIQMKKCETQNGKGLGFDVVPCFLLRPHDKNKFDFYLIPDGNNGWIRTNPRIDTDISANLQQKNSKTYRKVVKLLKFWNAQKFSNLITSSYYIELSICLAFLEQNNEDKYIKNISHGIALAFYGLNRSITKGALNSFIEKAPAVNPGFISEEKKQWLDHIRSLSLDAWNLECAGNNEKAMDIWSNIFGAEIKE
jgi:hypothetical protein